MPKYAYSWLDRIPTLSDDPTHPAQIALRTYALALSLSLGPSLVPFVIALATARRSSRTSVAALRRLLRREVGYDGFAFAVTWSVAGGAAIRHFLGRRLFCDAGVREAGADREGEAREGEGEGKAPRHAASGGPSLAERTLDILHGLKRYILDITPEQLTFLSNVFSSSVGILLLQAGRARTAHLHRASSSSRRAISDGPVDRTSPTLDLTLLLLVRAVDSFVQSFIIGGLTDDPETKAERDRPSKQVTNLQRGQPLQALIVRDKLEKERKKRDNIKRRQNLTSQVDAFVFWACSARIMWCFFYEPQRLPRSYVKWIHTLANLDGRLIEALRHIRAGTWSYHTGSVLHPTLLQTCATGLGHPASWGDPAVLPAYGGAAANEVWKAVGLKSRAGVGGIPCELLHGKVGSSLGVTESCTANSGLRVIKAFTEAMAIYLPVHFAPVLLTRPQTLLRPHRVLETLLGAIRSATFLSSFIGLYWYSVCLTRSVLLAKLFPFVSHDFWDGPLGCVMAGSLMCGSSIWIENGRRRGEMALYVLPRAIRACLPDAWLKSGNRGVRVAERIAFILSISTLLTAAAHRPDSLRGLSRWTLSFVTNGPNAGFWKRRRRDPSIPPTPVTPATPFSLTENRIERPYTPKINVS
ncbi:hypothetical protein B0H34DRAFT_45162 [Crassisporium funariophilum]|nr:hypothetical protein B0H34DRAFT_45162 [Crassisporium funariophilum]